MLSFGAKGTAKVKYRAKDLKTDKWLPGTYSTSGTAVLQKKTGEGHFIGHHRAVLVDERDAEIAPVLPICTSVRRSSLHDLAATARTKRCGGRCGRAAILKVEYRLALGVKL